MGRRRETALGARRFEQDAAALNAGAFVSADPEILEKLGFVDHGENVGEPEDFLD